MDTLIITFVSILIIDLSILLYLKWREERPTRAPKNTKYTTPDNDPHLINYLKHHHDHTI